MEFQRFFYALPIGNFFLKRQRQVPPYFMDIYIYIYKKATTESTRPVAMATPSTLKRDSVRALSQLFHSSNRTDRE